MRQGWAWAVSIAAVGLVSGCGGKPAQAASPTDTLVLEVGGEQPSLRASLEAMGRSVAPGYALRPRTGLDQLHTTPQNGGGAPEGPGVGGPGVEGPGPDGPGVQDPEQDPVVVPPDDLPEPAPESEWVIVKLPKDETLTHLSLRYLGTGTRFQEIMKWNGWSDEDTRRLRAGQDVRLKRSEIR